jgi:tetratricopeptide (TPR) repeat protein
MSAPSSAEVLSLDRRSEEESTTDVGATGWDELARLHFERGNVLREQRRLGEAATAFGAALACRPGFAEAWLNLGHLSELRGQCAEAITAYRHARSINPSLPEAHLNLGNALLKTGQSEAAIAAYRAALAAKPDYAEALLNLGNILQLQGQLDAAFACYERVLVVRPDSAEAHVNLGKIHRSRNQLDAALVACRRALALKPDLPQAHLNEAMVHLVSGNLRAGWPKGEYRWRIAEEPMNRVLPAPVWRGDTFLKGKTILLHAEQGLGDTLQFVRYLPLVAARGAKILLEVQPALRSLLAALPDVASIHSFGEELPRFDFHCPLMSLPLAFSTDLDSIPAATPYLRVPAERDARWRERLGPARGLRVGLVWAGNPGHPNDRNRSIPFPIFRSICSPLAGAEFFNLKIEACREDVTALADAAEIGDYAAFVHDFTDTAALVGRMDLVISVDTSVAHLAGALGKPVWLLLPFSPDWRWLLERDDSPWYPTMKLFRQTQTGDWGSVLHRMRESLDFLARRRRADQGGLTALSA